MLKLTTCALVLSVFLTGCAGLSNTDRYEYEEMMSAGLAPVEDKSVALAAVLNVLPGFGDIYTGEYGAFTLDFLLWPVSVVWAVPQGAVTAGQMNAERTWYYYRWGAGRGEWHSVRRSAPDR